MSGLHRNGRNHDVAQDVRLLGGARDAIFDAVNTFAIAKFTAIQLCATTWTIAQSFRAGFGTYIQRLIQAAISTRVTAHHWLFDAPLQLMQQLGGGSQLPQPPAHGSSKDFTHPRSIAK